ncbi:Ribose import permease protein RbsC [bioreactor metagenome]|uniref:Ribose import permease protein RbsC n=1 Tax=bioreactor metagenome TaxID=1076179 RepID=A0A645D5P9_9ZZZZ
MSDAKESKWARIGGWSRDHTNLLLLITLIIAGALLSENFFSWTNLMNLMRRISVNGVMAIGFTMTLLVGGFDLSIGATLSMCAVLCVGIEKSSGSAALGMTVAICAGLAMGALNGILMMITRGGSGEAFLITLATGMVGTAIALTYCSGLDIYGVNADWYKAIGQGNVATFPIAAIIWIVLMVIMQVIIKKTQFGRRMILSGANKKSAFLVGIDVNGMKLFGFTMAGLMAAFAAIIMTSRTTAASPYSGNGADFDAAIASIVGGNSLVGGKGGMVQVLIGVMIYGLITNILNLTGVDSVVQYIVKGLILLLAICLDKLNRR